MRNIILASLLALVLTTVQSFAQETIKPIDEAGIFLDGDCKAIASSPDGSTYVLMLDKKLIKIDSYGYQKVIPIPFNKPLQNLNDYFCDMDVDNKTAYFCCYNSSSIVALNLKDPKELKALKLSYENQPIRPMLINKTKDGWVIKDFDYRTFKVDSKGKLTLLPNFSEVMLDRDGKPVIKVNPYHKEGKLVFPGKINNEKNETKWTAPTPEPPLVVMNVEYLGYDTNQDVDMYLAKYSSGDLTLDNRLFAVDSNNQIVAQRLIPPTSLSFIMRYCKLANDGSIIAVYSDPENPNDRVILKKFELTPDTAPQKG